MYLFVTTCCFSLNFINELRYYNNQVCLKHSTTVKLLNWKIPFLIFWLYLPRSIFIWSCPWGEGHSVLCISPGIHILQCYKKVLEENFWNCSYRDDDVTNYVNFFKKYMRKMAKKKLFFLKLTLWCLEKKFKIFFQLLKVKVTYNLNIHI